MEEKRDRSARGEPQTTEGYMFFIGDTPMNCAGGWRMFWSEDLANSYLKPDERLPETTLRRVRVAVEVVK